MTATFTVFPAIDLKDGDCVRLVQGDMAKVTVFSHDPAAQAQTFEADGFSWLHVVDLNGAFAGKAINDDAVSAILSTTKLKVQLGGGIRDLSAIERWLEKGVARVVLGTAAVRDPDLVKSACRLFPEQVAIGLDARDGYVATDGWSADSNQSAQDLARAFENAGAAAIIYTDITRDGAMAGVNVDATMALARAVSTPVVASGGVRSVGDIRALKAVAPDGIVGVIVGRALYDGRITPADALAA